MTRDDTAQQPDWGRELGREATGRPETIVKWALLLVGFVAIALACVRSSTAFPLGVLFLLLGGGIAFLMIKTLVEGPTETRFFERGAIQRNRRVVKRIGYDQVQAVSFGRWLPGEGSIHYAIILKPHGDRPGKPFRFDTSRPTTTQDDSVPNQISVSQAYELSLHIAGHVARQMIDELAAGKSVNWLRDVHLVPEGVLIGKSLWPWAQVARAGLRDDGYFDVQVHGLKSPIIRVVGDAGNVLAGQVVIAAMQSAAANSLR